MIAITLDQEHSMRTGSKALLCCTNDRCKNATQAHKYIGHRVEEGIDYGEGWYQCLNCGTFRQDIRLKSTIIK